MSVDYYYSSVSSNLEVSRVESFAGERDSHDIIHGMMKFCTMALA